MSALHLRAGLGQKTIVSLSHDCPKNGRLIEGEGAIVKTGELGTAATGLLEPASAADIVYVSDSTPGIRRGTRCGRFIYLGPDGRPIRDWLEIARFNKLAIPPAYRDVWICPDPRGHLQATGRDLRGRKQYRYHPRWIEVRDAQKYDRLLSFAPRCRGYAPRSKRTWPSPVLDATK